MRNTISAGAWRPDLAGNAHKGLTEASGVYFTSTGYRPIKGFDPVTLALGDWAGGGAFIGSDGTSALLSGGDTALWRWSGSAWISVVAGGGRWQFGQFGDTVIAVFGGAPVKYDVVTGAGAVLGGSPPNAAYIAVAGNFVVLAGDVADVATVSWSGFNAAETWTPGTNQSDSQPIPDGGKITGLIGHENFFLVFQRADINRFQYIGQPGIFDRQKISSGIGCIAPGSIAQVGSLAFFLSERGFMMTDGNEVTPIGYDKVDTTFLARYARSELDNLTACVDPRQFLYKVAMPGNLGRVWVYNWREQEWTYFESGLKGVFPGFTNNISIDALDALYPGGIDTIPVSLDSPIFQGGEPRLYVVDETGVVGALSGANMAARLTWPYAQLGGGRSRVHNARPITDCTDGMTLTIDAKTRLGDEVAAVATAELRDSGHMPIRCNGRFLKPQIDIEAGAVWQYFQAVEIESGMGGER